MKSQTFTLKKLFFYIGLTLPIHALADSTHVFCAQRDDYSNWNWLTDDNLTVQGEWQYFSYQNATYEGFRISLAEYERLSGLCPENQIPQPASSCLSQWRLFIVENENQERLLAPGFLPDQPLNAVLLSPSENFKPYNTCTPTSGYFGGYWSNAPSCTFSQYPANTQTEQTEQL